MTRPNALPEVQKQNIKTLLTDIQSSIDQAPSDSSLTELKTSIKSAFNDRKLTQTELQTILEDVIDVVESAGVTASEMRTIFYDLQDIAEASRLPRTNDTLTGTAQDDVLWGGLGQDSLSGAGLEDAGAAEIDTLCGGGGKDTFVLGDATQHFYDDGRAKTVGLSDYALILDFNKQQDKIQLHGDPGSYMLDVLPAELDINGTGIYYAAPHQTSGDPTSGSRELVGVVLGVSLSDLSTGFSFV